MKPAAALIAPFALLLAAPGGAAADDGEHAPGVSDARLLPPAPPPERSSTSEASALESVAESFRAPVAGQVRIEQRLIIRVAPRPMPPPRDMLADLPRQAVPQRMAERRMGKCVPIAGIAGVQIGQDDRLLLFMRDQRIVSAALEKACRARDFYSGFYVERNGDGQLCTDRDKLQSRAGANCTVSRLRQLVADDDD